MITDPIDPAKFNLSQALYSKKQAAAVCSVSLTTINRLIRAGKLSKPVKIGAESKLYAADLARFLANLEAV